MVRPGEVVNRRKTKKGRDKLVWDSSDLAVGSQAVSLKLRMPDEKALKLIIFLTEVAL